MRLFWPLDSCVAYRSFIWHAELWLEMQSCGGIVLQCRKKEWETHTQCGCRIARLTQDLSTASLLQDIRAGKVNGRTCISAAIPGSVQLPCCLKSHVQLYLKYISDISAAAGVLCLIGYTNGAIRNPHANCVSVRTRILSQLSFLAEKFVFDMVKTHHADVCISVRVPFSWRQEILLELINLLDAFLAKKSSSAQNTSNLFFLGGEGGLSLLLSLQQWRPGWSPKPKLHEWRTKYDWGD